MLENKKVALIMGQSIEGCGVTRTAAEMYYWFKKNNYNFKIYSYDEKSYNRKKAHEMEYISFMKDDIPNIINELNKCDIVIFNSYPSNKFPKDAIIDFYNNLIKKVTSIKVGFMHELTKTNIDKIPFLLGIMNEMDIIYNFSEKTWFSKTLPNVLPSKKLSERVCKFTMWFNFDELDNIKNSIKLEDKDKKVLQLGRWTTMKDPRRILDIGYDLLKNNIKSELRGIERSIGAKFDIFEHPNCIDMTGKEVKYISENACVPVYGTYIRDEGIKELSRSLFGSSFYRMPKDPDGYGDRMEYTQIEIIGVGSIPIFDKHWGENNRTKDNIKYIDIPYSAIYSDKDNLNETINKIIEVANDVTLQKKYIETSNKLVKQEFDANIVLPKMFKYILETGRDENKFKNDIDMINSLTNGNIEFINLYNEYVSKNEIPVLGIRELYDNNIFCILDGKKEKEIKKFKRS